MASFWCHLGIQSMSNYIIYRFKLLIYAKMSKLNLMIVKLKDILKLQNENKITGYMNKGGFYNGIYKVSHK